MKKNIFSVTIIYMLLLVSCKSTYLASSWREPNKQVSISNLNKVLVIAWFKDETSRRKAEDKMAAYLNGRGVVSYNYLDDNFNRQSEEAMRYKIKTDGFDGAVVMRLLDVAKDQYYVPGTNAYPQYYRSFSGYYYRKWNYNSTPGYYTTTKTYTVETNIYSIKEDKIIWSGVTKTTDPSGVDKMTTEIADIVYKKMKDEGFVSK